MFQKISVSLFLFFAALTVTVDTNAQALTATQILNRIHFEYAQRFDSNGRYIDDQNLTNRFKASQLNAIQILRQNKMIVQSFQIRNSAMADLTITVSIVQEQNLDFAGLLIERNKYDHPDSEALLRLFNFPILAKGMSLFSLDGNTVASVKSQGLTAENGGFVLVKYPVDFNSDQFDQVELALVRTASGFTFKTPNGTGFSTMILEVWYNIFSQNFGVENVTFQ